MPQTAWATTATATTFKPWSQPGLTYAPKVFNPRPKRVMASAEGNAKPSQATIPPTRPARALPSAMTTWLLAGPGRNWLSATISA